MLLFFSLAVLAADMPTAAELLDRVDKNMTFETRTTQVTMTVADARRTRTYTMQTYGRGLDEAAIEYLAPARDKGTRMLRTADEMWMYLPSVERTQKISGHMLRQGMMGSDVSYEDMMSTTALRKTYDATVRPETEQIDGHTCYVVDLTAKDESATYATRVSWVDTKSSIPIKQELYALSGMLIKTWKMGDIQDFEGGRQFPMKMEVVDEVKKGSTTTLEFSEMKFGVDLEAEVFTKRWLERG